MKQTKIQILFLFILLSAQQGLAQRVPELQEGIDYLVTTGKEAKVTMGDDDHVQIFFFTIPVEEGSESKPFYIRIFDPDVGGKIDEEIGVFNTQVRYSLYGGIGCHSFIAARGVEPIGNYKSGNLIFTKMFSNDAKYDNLWYTSEAINPALGEKMRGISGDVYTFKLICEGVSGDDGNLYQYFLSASPTQNVEVSGGKAFTYEYTFRVKGETNIYPFVDADVKKVKIQNFDFDSDGIATLFAHSMAAKMNLSVSADANWVSHEFPVNERDHGKFLQLQFKPYGLHKNNNITLYVTNQVDEALPFYPAPLKNLLPANKASGTFQKVGP